MTMSLYKCHDHLKQGLPFLPLSTLQRFLYQHYVGRMTGGWLRLQIFHRFLPTQIGPAFITAPPKQPNGLLIVINAESAAQQVIKRIEVPSEIPAQILGHSALHLVIKRRQVMKLISV